MEDEKKPHLVRGLVAGAVGGLVASWVMNVFMADAGPKLQQTVDHLTGQPEQQGGQQNDDDSPKEDATMKAADAVISAVTGGRHLSFEEKQQGGPIVHYAFGGLMGAVYGASAEYSSVARAGFGTVFASALFAGADLVAVPALHLSGSSSDTPISSLATPFSAHLVYGITTEAVRRLLRAVL